jgi:GNAT superfamily N-acetyltransferase
MGSFVGIRAGARLVAMGGERLAMDGFARSDRALHASRLPRPRDMGKRCSAQRILDAGCTPFLRVYASNISAIDLYERMGFTIRARVTHAIWKRAG